MPDQLSLCIAALIHCCGLLLPLTTGDFDDLSLTFTATVTEPVPESKGGGTRQREVELKPGGRDIIVRADNVIEYIHRLADFRLNRQMDRAAAAFLRGFFELIKPQWVRMFNEAELQMLISGSEEGVDVDDLMKHINFAGARLLTPFWMCGDACSMIIQRSSACCDVLPSAAVPATARACSRHNGLLCS